MNVELLPKDRSSQLVDGHEQLDRANLAPELVNT